MSERMEDRICAECHALLEHGGEYHPYAFCVLRKAGLNPLDVVTEAMKALAPDGTRWRLVRDTTTTESAVQ